MRVYFWIIFLSIALLNLQNYIYGMHVVVLKKQIQEKFVHFKKSIPDLSGHYDGEWYGMFALSVKNTSVTRENWEDILKNIAFLEAQKYEYPIAIASPVMQFLQKNQKEIEKEKQKKLVAILRTYGLYDLYNYAKNLPLPQR